VRLADAVETLDLDLDRASSGLPTGAGRLETEPLYLVCTHGRHDPCCAERGRPLAAAMSDAGGDRAWECSHIGGDRFAGNLLCFPHGLYFGRAGPQDGPRIAAAYARGK